MSAYSHRPRAAAIRVCMRPVVLGCSVAALAAAISSFSNPAAAQQPALRQAPDSAQTGQVAPATLATADTAAAPAEAPADAPEDPQAAGDQIAIDPVDVTAAKPKKKVAKTGASAKSRPKAPAPDQPQPLASAPLTAPAAITNPAGASEPASVQSRAQPGRLTLATPINGTVIEQSQIEETHAVDTQRELLRQVPGVSLIRNIRIPIGGKAYTNNLIDGLSTRSASLGTFGYLDEVNLFDVAAVELTRGPGSVLHSSKAFGGTINVITRDPPQEQEQWVFADLGMYGYKRLGAAAAGSSGTGGIGYSISANHLDDDAWRDRGGREKDQASAKIVLRPGEDTKLTLRGEYTNYFIEYPGVLTQAQFEADWRQAQYLNLYEDKQFLTGSIDLRHRVGEAGELVLAYAVHQNWGEDGCPSGCSSSAASTTLVDIHYLTNNLRALYRQDFDFMMSRIFVGMDAFFSEKSDDNWRRRQNEFERISLNRAFSVDETTLAPFAQYEFSPLERLRFNLGVRYEDYTLKVEDRSPTPTKDGEKHYSDLVRKAGVTYEFARNHFLWGGIAEGFYVPDTGATISGDNAKDLEPETSLTYNAGIRGLFGKTFNYDIGYYHTDIDNFYQSVTCPGRRPSAICPDWTSPRSSYPLAGAARFEGVETSLGVNPWSFVRFDVAHTYAINTYIDYEDIAGDYSGNTLPASPKHHLNARVTLLPLPGLKVQLEGDYYSRYFLNALNSDSYARPIIYTLRVAYQAAENVELWGHALNLFDTKYADRVSATNVADPIRSYNEGYGPLTIRTGVNIRW